MCFMQGQDHQPHHPRAEGLGVCSETVPEERLLPFKPPASDSMVTYQLRA